MIPPKTRLYTTVAMSSLDTPDTGQPVERKVPTDRMKVMNEYTENCTACGTRLRFEGADTFTEADDIRHAAYVELPRLRAALEAVIRNDKTVYDYRGANAKNRNGLTPGDGRFKTPREIAQDALR